MNTFDVIRIIKWTLMFQNNLAPPNLGLEMSVSELHKAAKDCQRGHDPYESAHEIGASRRSGIALPPR